MIPINLSWNKPFVISTLAYQSKYITLVKGRSNSNNIQLKLLRNNILIFCLWLFTFSSFAQGNNDTDYLKEANEAFVENRFEDASRLFREVVKTSPENIEAQYLAGMATFKSGRKAASLPYFKAVYRLNPHHDKSLLKFLGRTYQLNYQFDSAIAIFNEYKSHIHKHEKHNQVLERDLIDKRIQECETAKELIKNPKEVKIANMGDQINSKYDDYSPAIAADEQALMFTSRRDTEDGNDFSKKDYAFFEEVFITERKDSIWTAARSLSDNVNGKKHDACVSVSPDGQKLIVYKSNHISKGDLYFSDLKNGVWTEPVKFGGEINSNFFEPSATINSSENILIFSSDRPGGFGGLDLYISRLLPNGKWGKPENLGTNINTKYDEDAPFLQTDQRTLHFSSSGHNSIGGYDIFTTYYDSKDKSWTKPDNLGYPINTPDDDIYFSWNNEGTRAYFSSVREDTYGGQDLYVMDFPNLSPPMIVLKGVVTDKKTKSPLGSSIKISIYTLDSNQIVGIFNSNNVTGKYILALPHNKMYGLQVESDGYIPHSDNYSAPKIFDFLEVVKNIELQPIDSGNVVVLNNINFDYNKSDITKSSEIELKVVADFMVKNLGIEVEIGGHTDSVGSEVYNQKLSETRAFAVKTFLENSGVEGNRLSSKGYNFSKPIATNQTPEGRQMNRRTEFMIVKGKEQANHLSEVK